MRLVDLSAPIPQSPPETPDVLRTDIDFSGHAEGAAQIEALLGVPARLLRDGEGWAIETFTQLRHAQLDPRGRALALQLDDRGRAGRRRSTSCRWSGSSPTAWCST